MSAASAAAAIDQRALVMITTTLIGVNSFSFSDPGNARYIYDSIGSKLSANGVKGWLAHLVALSDNDIDVMLGPSDRNNHVRNNLDTPFTVLEKSQLRILRAYFQCKSRIDGKP